MNDVYRISAEGGMPVAVTADRFVAEFSPLPRPTAIAGLYRARQHVRPMVASRHSHLDESEIWLANGGKYEMLAGGDSNVSGRCGAGGAASTT